MLLEKVQEELDALGMESDAALAALTRVEALFAAGRPDEVPAICRTLVDRFTRAGIKGAAMTALAYLRETVATGHATPVSVRLVRDFIRDTTLRRVGSTPHTEPPLDDSTKRLDGLAMPVLVTNPIAAEIGERILLYREEHGLSQKQMAEKIGITPSQLCRYEKGTEIPGTIALARIAAFMQCPIDYVYHGRLEQIVGKIDAMLREPFIELHDFSEECRRAVYESAYAHMSKEIMQKRARKNPDTGIIPGKPKKGRNDS